MAKARDVEPVRVGDASEKEYLAELKEMYGDRDPRYLNERKRLREQNAHIIAERKAMYGEKDPRVRKPAKDRAALHRALDAVLDRKAAKDAYPVPTAALKSPAAAKKFLENIVEKMQPTYSKEEDARQRYKDASNDQRRSRDLSAKWDAASAKVAEVEKDFQTALKTIQAAIPGFQDPT